MTVALSVREEICQLEMVQHARPGLLRPGLALWIALVIGWGTAGVAAVAAVREHRAASRLSTLGGFTPVQGPGVEVVVSDATRPLRKGENPSETLVQDGDLIFLNMMLWYGGARAVAINGERVTATTTITSSGPTILINGRRNVGPFHVIAIGDPRMLREVLEGHGGFVDRMRRAEIGVQVIQHRELTVPAYRGEGSGGPTSEGTRDYAGDGKTVERPA
jgi:uncharacterized protein YlxW (UPF0749 family)